MFDDMRRRRPNQLPLDQRLGLTIDHSAAALDCGRSKIYDLIGKGKLQVIDVDGMRRVTGESLRALVAAQNEATE